MRINKQEFQQLIEEEIGELLQEADLQHEYRDYINNPMKPVHTWNTLDNKIAQLISKSWPDLLEDVGFIYIQFYARNMLKQLLKKFSQ